MAPGFRGQSDFCFAKHRKLQYFAGGEKVPALTAGLYVVGLLSRQY